MKVEVGGWRYWATMPVVLAVFFALDHFDALPMWGIWTGACVGIGLGFWWDARHQQKGKREEMA